MHSLSLVPGPSTQYRLVTSRALGPWVLGHGGLVRYGARVLADGLAPVLGAARTPCPPVRHASALSVPRLDSASLRLVSPPSHKHVARRVQAHEWTSTSGHPICRTSSALGEGAGVGLRIQKGALRIRPQKRVPQDPWWGQGALRIRAENKVLSASPPKHGLAADPYGAWPCQRSKPPF